MKRKRFSVEQIVAVLKQAEVGVLVAELIRQVGISEQTLYRWKKQYKGLETDQVRQFKQVQDENARLKRLVAELTLDKVMLQDVLAKNVLCLSKTSKCPIKWGIILAPQFSLRMPISLTAIFAILSSIVRSRVAIEFENLALRHQIGVLQRSARKRLKLTPWDRLLWVWLSRLWRDWRSALVIVKPETVVAWHRSGFRLFWTWKVRRGQSGRPVISREVRCLIRQMCRENPSWGAPRIHGELLKLGINIGESSVSKYMVRCYKPPSQTWRTFLENHAKQLVSIDFFTVPTLRFQVLYVFLVLAHDRRRVLHFNVTAHPTAEWTGQQLREAFPFDQLPRYLLRDRDAIFGNDFREQVRDMGIREVLSAPRSPWQRDCVERVIGSIRRECLDHVIVLHESSLRRTLYSYFDYYHRSRTHLSLCKDSPEPRSIQRPEMGSIVAVSQVGGLHHRYERRAA